MKAVAESNTAARSRLPCLLLQEDVNSRSYIRLGATSQFHESHGYGLKRMTEKLHCFTPCVCAVCYTRTGLPTSAMCTVNVWDAYAPWFASIRSDYWCARNFS